MSEALELRRAQTFDLAEYPFPSAVADILEVGRLDHVHTRYPLPDGASGDQDTPAHEVFYREYPRVRALYERFLREHIAREYDEGLCVQRVPSFRVHYPGAIASREFHRDSDYNHQPGTINYWLPLTEAFATNTFWVETEPDSGEFSPIEMVPGELLRFDALRLRHGSYANETGMSRVSLDFRVIPLSEHRYSGLRSGASGIPLQLGGYYMLLTEQGEFEHVGSH